MLELIQSPFIQRAFLGALLSGIAAPAIGFYVVQRQLSMIGDGLSHIAIAGVGLALLTNQSTYLFSILICVGAAIVLELVRTHSRVANDLALAILFYGGLAFGVLTASMAGPGSGGLSSFLFGSITTITSTDLVLLSALCFVNLVVTFGLFKQLAAISTDPDYAHIRGLPVRLGNLVILVLTALTISLSIRAVGALLIGALLVIPVASASNIGLGLFRTLTLSVVFGVLSAVVGLWFSILIDSSPGASIILVSIALFILTLITTLVKERLKFS